MPQIEVTFDIDVNGIVNVSAKDKATNKEQQIRIQASGGLSDGDIEQMIKDAEANAEADKQRKELVEVKNQAESLVHSTEKNLEEYGDKIDAGDKSTIESAIADLKAVMESEEPADIQAKLEALQQAAMKMGEAIYKAQQEEAAQGAAAEAGADMGDDASAESTAQEGEVLDAEFEEVDEDKKG